MSDLIKREDAIKVLDELSACEDYGVEIGTDEETYIGKYEAITEISDLPSARPKEGKWFHYEGMLYCSECHTEIYNGIMEYLGDDVPKFCPNCGADMRERKDFQVIVNGNCTKCGKPLSGNRIFICEECEEQSKESCNDRLGGERRSHKGNR